MTHGGQHLCMGGLQLQLALLQRILLGLEHSGVVHARSLCRAHLLLLLLHLQQQPTPCVFLALSFSNLYPSLQCCCWTSAH